MNCWNFQVTFNSCVRVITIYGLSGMIVYTKVDMTLDKHASYKEKIRYEENNVL